MKNRNFKHSTFTLVREEGECQHAENGVCNNCKYPNKVDVRLRDNYPLAHLSILITKTGDLLPLKAFGLKSGHALVISHYPTTTKIR